jgi:hypothetical protein
MTAVQSQDIENLMSLRDNHDRCVCKPNPEILVAGDNLRCQCDILGCEWLEAVDTSGHFSQERLLRLDTDTRSEQVIELGQHKRRQQKRPSHFPERRHRVRVLMLAQVDRSQQAACVE